MNRLIIPESFKVFCLRRVQHVPRRWWLAVYCLTLACTVRGHHYVGHPLVPVPFPHTPGSYRHTSSVVNVPIHQERVIIIKKPGNHQQHNGYPHEFRHAHTRGRTPQREHMHEHDSIQPDDRGHGYREQESPTPFMGDMRPFLNYYQAPRSHHNPYFQDLGYLLDPRFIQQSIWLEQFPDMI